MTDYNDGKWHGWSGGECPVHPESVLEIVYGECREEAIAKYCEFRPTIAGCPIVAFRVVKEHRKPREFYAAKDTCFDLNGNITGRKWSQCDCDAYGAVKFREVIGDE